MAQMGIIPQGAYGNRNWIDCGAMEQGSVDLTVETGSRLSIKRGTTTVTIPVPGTLSYIFEETGLPTLAADTVLDGMVILNYYIQDYDPVNDTYSYLLPNGTVLHIDDQGNVVRIHDESNPFYDPNSVVLMARASTGWPDIGVMLKGSVLPDGSLKIGRLHKNEGDVLFTHIPGGDLKFHVLYDAESGLYWLLHSQIDGRMNQRRRLALSYSPDLIRWTFAGLVAVGPADNAARHYATMIISGSDLFIVSRSGDMNARNAHDGNLVTFHRVKNFRKLVY